MGLCYRKLKKSLGYDHRNLGFLTEPSFEERKVIFVGGEPIHSEDLPFFPDGQKFLSALIDRYRYSSLGELLKGIIHNLNGSLQILSMQMELLQRMLARQEDKVQGQVEKCLGQIDKFKGLLGPLIQKGIHDEQDTSQPIHLNELLEEELSLLHHNLFFKHQVLVRRNLSAPLPSLKGYYVDFSQGLSNLIQNALEAMENSSPKELTLTTKVKANQVLVGIRDTGCGISEEIKPNLFKPFFTDKKGKHQGLGLYIAKALLTPYGASFQYSSRRGETAVEVSFPIKPGASRPD